MTRIIQTILVGTALLCGQAAQAQTQTQSQAQTGTPAPTGVVVPAAGNPNLAVASVKLENGVRVSKIIGSSIYSDPNTTIGSVEDLIMTRDDKVVMVIVSVGGFVGLGSKLVAFPFGQLKSGDDGKMMLPGVTKEQLNGMPNFVY